jgi:hypothetical protein
VPPFSWGTKDQLDVYDIERFLGTAELVMARRKVSFEDGNRSLLRRAWERTRSDRE